MAKTGNKRVVIKIMYFIDKISKYQDLSCDGVNCLAIFKTKIAAEEYKSECEQECIARLYTYLNKYRDEI